MCAMSSRGELKPERKQKMTEEVKPAPRPAPEELDNIQITPEMVASWVAHDRLEEAEAKFERDEERAREAIRVAYRQGTGVDPTQAEIEATLAEKRRVDAAEVARRNEAYASAAIRRNF